MNTMATTYRWSDPDVRASDIASLARTPILIREIYVGRSPAWLDSRHNPDTFSPREVLGHLCVCETDNWIPRVRLTLESRQESPFQPFDVLGGNQMSYDLRVEDLVQQFADLRRDSLGELDRLKITDADLGKTAIHPKFGSVTLDQLLTTWVAHDLYHLGQIFKSFSAPLQPHIGPWQEFLNLPQFN